MLALAIAEQTAGRSAAHWVRSPLPEVRWWERRRIRKAKSLCYEMQTSLYDEFK